MPVLIVILGNSLVHVLSKPLVWMTIFAWVVVAKFDVGVFSKEVIKTVNGLWWVVALIFLFYLLTNIIPMYFNRNSK